MRIALLLLTAACFTVGAAKKPKTPKAPKPPSQPPITQGCVTVYDIYSHAFGILSNITSVPGLDAKIRNSCGQTAQVFLRIGYFNSRGGQFGDGLVSATVGSGAVYTVIHEMYPAMYNDLLKTARILTVEAF